MHGRLKVKSTAEQQEAKRKERLAKLQKYNAATSKIFAKKEQGELDEELLLLTGGVLTANPDFYTLWNFRKEVFLEMKKSVSEEKLKQLFLTELHFLEACLMTNPKSYGTWHHRCFIMDTTPDPDWARELDLCNQFLKYDERNFHCWDYRRFVVNRAKISPEEELEFSMSKISNNFSNYSSWHYRSKLLPVIHPDCTQPMKVAEHALLKEYELVQNGIFTDPDDQSNWFYHRWLMGRGEQQQAIHSVSVSVPHKSITLSFQKHLQVDKSSQILVKCNGEDVDGINWTNHERKTKGFSTLWIGDGLELSSGCDHTLEVALVCGGSEVCSHRLSVTPGADTSTKRWLPPRSSSRFRQELSAVKSETLQQELESVMMLMDVETDNKWAVLTVVLLMKALDPGKYGSDIMNYLKKLEALDYKRSGYYKDLRSKFVIEDAIDLMDQEEAQSTSASATSALVLPGREVTKLEHPELLTLVTTADLASNSLRDTRPFRYLVSLHDLTLDNNLVESCEGIQNLPCLQKLSVANNLISSHKDVLALQSCPRLETLNLSGNPVTEQEEEMAKIRELLPHIEVITTQQH